MASCGVAYTVEIIGMYIEVVSGPQYAVDVPSSKRGAKRQNPTLKTRMEISGKSFSGVINIKDPLVGSIPGCPQRCP